MTEIYFLSHRLGMKKSGQFDDLISVARPAQDDKTVPQSKIRA
jgi:hypothetical protein